MAFREDEGRVRVGDGAENLAILRHLALNLPRRDATRKGGIAIKRFTAALDQDYPLAVLAGRHH